MTILKTVRQHWVSEPFWTKKKGGRKYYTSAVRMGEKEAGNSEAMAPGGI